jgi:DNA-binding XRE family transcriptional regulator
VGELRVIDRLFNITQLSYFGIILKEVYLGCRLTVGDPILKSLYSAKYQLCLELLVEARKEAGVTQQVLAKKLGRPQSFVSKIENGERRVDVVEFLVLCRAVGADPYVLLRKVEGTGRRN